MKADAGQALAPTGRAPEGGVKDRHRCSSSSRVSSGTALLRASVQLALEVDGTSSARTAPPGTVCGSVFQLSGVKPALFEGCLDVVFEALELTTHGASTFREFAVERAPGQTV